MKGLYYLLIAILLLSINTSCNKEDDNDDIIVTEVELPSNEKAFKPGEEITIQGKGFSAQSEIWFRDPVYYTFSISSKATESNRDEVKAEVKSYTSNSITIITPDVSGEQEVVLKQNGKEQILGSLYFEIKYTIPGTFRLFRSTQQQIDVFSDDVKYLFYEIDPLNFEQVLLYELFPKEDEVISLSFTYYNVSNEILGIKNSLAGTFLIKINVDNKTIKNVPIDKSYASLENLLIHNNKVYGYNESSKELVQIDITEGTIIPITTFTISSADSFQSPISNLFTNEIIGIINNGQTLSRTTVHSGYTTTIPIGNQQSRYTTLANGKNTIYAYKISDTTGKEERLVIEYDIFTGKETTIVELNYPPDDIIHLFYNHNTHEILALNDTSGWKINIEEESSRFVGVAVQPMESFSLFFR